jgi:hypothetical protein
VLRHGAEDLQDVYLSLFRPSHHKPELDLRTGLVPTGRRAPPYVPLQQLTRGVPEP